MAVKRFSFMALLTAAVILGHGIAKAADEPQIIERTIKIEGVVEKPRVFFIVPRAKIWKEYSIKKSFYTDILKPVYPEAFVKDFLNEGTGNNYRR